MSRVLPILFNTEMVRAILDGRKSCIRRIVKGYIPKDAQFGYTVFTPDGSISCRGLFEITGRPGYGEKFFKLPYQPGDILYVRETWGRFECRNCEGDERGNCPKEPQKSVLDKTCGCYMYRATDEISGDAKWHPSIRMPKEAARIWLKVTDVRVEKLQEITTEDALKEGADRIIHVDGSLNEHAIRTCFLGMWNRPIKKSDIDCYGWDANPWVWVIEFERCEKPEGV